MNNIKSIVVLPYQKHKRTLAASPPRSGIIHHITSPNQPQAIGSFPPSLPDLSPHRPWNRFTSVIALVGYIGQLACQLILISGLWGGQSISIWAMDMDRTRSKPPLQLPETRPLVHTQNTILKPQLRMEEESPYVFKYRDQVTDGIVTKIFTYSDEQTLGQASQVCWRWYRLVDSLDRPALTFNREREELIGRILEATDAEFSPIAVASRNPKLQDIRDLLIEPEELLIESEKLGFSISLNKTVDHPFFGGIIAREKKLVASTLCPWDVLAQYRRYRDRCVTLQGKDFIQHIIPKAILYIDDGRIYRISRDLAYKINSINEYNLSQRENDAGNHAVCHLGSPGRSVHFKNNNCHTDLSPAMESAMYGFYSLIAPSSVTPSCFIRIEGLPIKGTNPIYPDLKGEWNEVERGDKTFTSFLNRYADKQKNLFEEKIQNFILQGSRTAEGMRFDTFLKKVAQGEASYDTINRESFSYHILLSLLFNPSDYKADNMFLSPEGHIVGIDNDGCLAHPIVFLGTKQKEYHVGVKNVLYLLPLMQEAIHENVIKTFRTLNIPLTLLRWMSFLDAQDQRHRTTFNRQGIERHIDDGHSFPVRLVPGTMTTLYEDLRNLQITLSDSWGMTHQQLLMRFQPLVGEAYQAHLKNINLKNTNVLYFLKEKLFNHSSSNSLEAMSTIYDRTQDLQKLLPHRIHDLQNQAQSKDAYILNRTASLAQEIQDLFLNLHKDDTHLAQVLDYLVSHLADYIPYLPLMQDPDRLKRMLAAGASIASLRGILAQKSQTPSKSLQWESEDFITYIKTFMPQHSHRHLKGNLNPIVSFILTHFPEWVDELLPILPENAWHQIVQEQNQGRKYTKAVFDFLMRRSPLGINGLVNGRAPLDDAFDDLLKSPQENCTTDITVDLIHRGAWQISLLGRQYRDLKKKGDLPSSFWQAFQTLQARNAKIGWTVTLEELFPYASSPKQQAGKNTILGTSGEARTLTSNILKQLQDPSHKVPEGRRDVIRVESNGCFAFIKFYPELVGIEESVGELTRRTIGFGAPYGELFKFPDKSPAWVSQGIPGDNMQWVLKNDPGRLNKLDPVSTTQLILMAMLVNPEDGKPDNYIVEPLPGNSTLYRLSSPDNDHGFVPAFVKTKPNPESTFTKPELVVQVKTFLYCLNLMNQPIPEETKALFLKGDPLVLMQDWLEVLDRRNRGYEALYPSIEAAALFKAHECFMGVPFQKGMVSNLYIKWIQFQDCLWEKSLTPMQLLSKVEPRLANRYQEAFKDLRNKTAWERFKRVDGAFYQQKGDHLATITLSGLILTSQNIPIQESALESIRSGKELGPKQALQELQEIAKQMGQVALPTESRVTGKQWEIFWKRFDFGQFPISTQRNILNDLVSHAATIKKLILKNCAAEVLDNSLSQKNFLWSDLVRLDLRGCSAIIHKTLPALSQNMPSLEVLNLSNLPEFRWMATAGIINYDPISFKQLRKLNVINCTALEAIVLDAPNLENLSVNGAKELTTLRVKSSELQFEMNITGCENLTDEVFAVISDQCKGLRALRTSGMPKVQNIVRTESSFLLKKTLKPVEFLNLIILDISRQPSLKYINVHAPHLRSLIASGCTSLNFVKIKSHSLESLDIQECFSFPQETLESIVQNNSLTSINTTGCPEFHLFEALNRELKDIPLALYASFIKDEIRRKNIIKCIQNIAKIGKLSGYSEDYKYGDEGMVFLSELIKRNSLKGFLDLRAKSIGSTGVKALTRALKFNTTLTGLCLAANYIWDEGAKFLVTTFKTNTSLTILNLGSAGISSEGAKVLGEMLETNKTLKTLWLCDNKMGVIGGKAFGNALKNNKSLKDLSLSDTNMGDEGLKSLVAGLEYNQTLEDLSLDTNQITESGVTFLIAALEKNKSLIKLKLWNSTLGLSITTSNYEIVRNWNDSQVNLRRLQNNISDQSLTKISDFLSRNQSLK